MPEHFPDLTPLEALAALASPTAPTLLDVRLPEDQDGTRLPGALPLPCDDRDAHLAACPHGAIVICHKGLKISAGATARLRRVGCDARRLRGGHVGWQAADLPLDSAPSPSRIALPLDASATEVFATWATFRFRAPRAELLEVPRADLDGVCARFGAVLPSQIPPLPGLDTLSRSLDTVVLALHAAPPSALFSMLDLAFRGALRHETDTPMLHAPAEEAHP